MSTISSAIASAFSAILSPIKTALEAGVTNPGALLGNLQGLAISSVINLPTLENEAASAGCSEALTLLADLEAKLTGATLTPPETSTAIPLIVTTSAPANTNAPVADSAPTGGSAA